jgi:hypothetical protein
MGLTIRVVDGPKVTANCGGALLTVEWQLAPADSGFVIQHVIFTFGDFACNDRPITRPRTFEYFEAWEVKGGVVYAGRASASTRISAANGTDFFVLPDEGEGTKGTNRIDGHVRFLPNYTLPNTFQRQKKGFPAGVLPASRTAPPGWSDAGADDHTLDVTWKCCPLAHIRPVAHGTPRPKSMPKRILQSARCFPSNDVAEIIRAVPPWAPVERAPLAEIQKHLDPLRKFPLSAIREGAELYVAYSVSTQHYGVEEMGRLYLLNRYVLAIPERVPEDQDLSFGGWVIPGDESIGSLWPFSFRNGKLRLTERFHGYAGAPYDALGEFDYFVGYGPRWKSGRRAKKLT